MQATTLTQLNRIAQAGANKITETGTGAYTVAATDFAHIYRVTNPNGITYRVSVKKGAEYCACKFYEANRFSPATKTGFKMGTCTCKHIVYLQEREHIDAQAAEYADAENDRIEAEVAYLMR